LGKASWPENVSVFKGFRLFDVFVKMIFPKMKCFWERFWGCFWECFWENLTYSIKRKGRSKKLRKKNYKGRCIKKAIPKCTDGFRGYDGIMVSYVDVLSKRNDIVEISCNVPLDEKDYTSDFLCKKESGEYMVRECVNRKLITKPMTVKLLDESREYWLRRGITDWGIVIDEA